MKPAGYVMRGEVKPVGKRPLERWGYRWEDNEIRCEGVRWMYLAQERDLKCACEQRWCSAGFRERPGFLDWPSGCWLLREVV